MQESYGHWTLLFCFMLVYGSSQQKCSSHARKLEVNRHVNMNKESRSDPSLNVFFTPDDLKAGKKLPIFFPIRNTSETPKLLPKEMADSLPFSASNLSYLLDFFSISTNSPQSTAMEYTLKQCELEPMREETKFCATSLETLLDSTTGVFGLGIKIKAMTTSYPRGFKTQLQNYTIVKEPNKIWVPRIVSCHTMPYPYLVFYCHSQRSDNMLYEVSLRGEEGDEVEAIAICHMDTSEWDRDHVVFRVLNVEPGASTVCHFYPADNIAWIPASDDSDG